MDYEQILTDTSDSIRTITLNRPGKLNAFTRVMLSELLDAVEHADADDDVRAVIVTGAGRAFCAGADLSGGGSTFDRDKLGPRSEQTLRDGGGQLTTRIFEMRKPIIAAINGAAVGVGITMTLAMDFRLCVPDAKIGFVFSRRGIVPEAASSWFLPRLVGISKALEWTYSGRIFSGTEAHEHRLVASLHSPDQLMDDARHLAKTLTSDSSGVSVALTRKLMWTGLGATHPMQAHIADSKAMYAMGQSRDAAEGISAFLEKRQAEFPMKVSSDVPDLGLESPTFDWSGP